MCLTSALLLRPKYSLGSYRLFSNDCQRNQSNIWKLSPCSAFYLLKKLFPQSGLMNRINIYHPCHSNSRGIAVGLDRYCGLHMKAFSVQAELKISLPIWRAFSSGRSKGGKSSSHRTKMQHMFSISTLLQTWLQSSYS